MCKESELCENKICGMWFNKPSRDNCRFYGEFDFGSSLTSCKKYQSKKQETAWNMFRELKKEYGDAFISKITASFQSYSLRDNILTYIFWPTNTESIVIEQLQKTKRDFKEKK